MPKKVINVFKYIYGHYTKFNLSHKLNFPTVLTKSQNSGKYLLKI